MPDAYLAEPPDRLIESILAQPTRAAQRRCLRETVDALASAPAEQEQRINELAEALKERVIQNLWADISAAVQIADLILFLARITRNEMHRALGLRAKAQALSIGLGEHRKALRLYRKALAIHRRYADRLGQALVYLTEIWAMANLGMYRQAVKAGEWSGQVFQEYQQWRSFATLQTNLAAIHNHYWQLQRALECTEEASRVFRQMGEAGWPFLANNEVNRARALCNLGRFPESLIASQMALEEAQAHDQKIVYARAQHNLAITHHLMGRYNQALDLLIQASSAHRAAGQPHEAALCELTAADCLLELNRMEAALEKCQALLPLFQELGMRLEAAETAHLQAVAYLRLERAPEAIAALVTVRALFIEEQIPHWAARTDLEIAQAYLQYGQPVMALPVARQSAAALRSLGLPYETVQAQAAVAQALLETGNLAGARKLLETELPAVTGKDLPALVFQLRRLLGRVLLAEGQQRPALVEYTRSVEALEGLRSQVMLEYRANFLQEREAVYSEVVSLCLDLDAALALEFAERARSRAMLELLSGRADLSLRARNPEDRPLLEQIREKQAEHQQIIRGLDSLALQQVAPRAEAESAELKERLLGLEKEITGLWHTLIIRNTAYTQDAALWEPQLDGLAGFVQALEPQTLLLEYFTLENELVLFVVQSGGENAETRIETIRLPVTRARIEQMVQLLQLNFQAVPVTPLLARTSLEANARGLLNRLYKILLAPARERIDGYRRLVIVPHGPLHYLPFHALYDGQRYLVETHSLRYLPAASWGRQEDAETRRRGDSEDVASFEAGTSAPAAAADLRISASSRLLARRLPVSASPMLAIGHSYQGRLPFTIQEARSVARLWETEPLLEQDATLEHLRAVSPDCRLIHLACHGDFRPDNPLFSGLALEAGWLTTLDIFNLRLKASLVTLSACQTGQGVIGGGDELTGLMRALLSAGAASLVLSQWAVSDQSTAQLMEYFYGELAAGAAKADALRTAQLRLLEDGTADYRHPYFWAPFFLIGEDGRL